MLRQFFLLLDRTVLCQICVILTIAILFSACQKTTYLPQEDFVSSNSLVNQFVGENMIELSRQRAQTNLCIRDHISFLVIDVGRTSSKVPPKRNVIRKYDIVNKWFFESNKKRDENLTLSTKERIAFYIRPASSNYSLMHEMGHNIFIKYVMKMKLAKGEYGSVAPDWLDEIAAIGFENDMESELRRNNFFDYLDKKYIFTLNSYLLYEHRGKFTSTGRSTIKWGNGQVKKFYDHQITDVNLNSGRETSVDRAVYFWNEKEQRKFTKPLTDLDTSLFYDQSRIFLDYLLEKSENKCILADIGHFIAKGNTFVDWLKVQDQISGMHNIAELENQFMTWVREEASRRNSVSEKLDNGG